MNHAGLIYTELTLAMIIALGAITIYFLDDFGELVRHGDIKQSGYHLTGDTVDHLKIMSIVTMSVVIIWVAFFAYGFTHIDHSNLSRSQKNFWILALVSMVLPIALAGANLRLIEDFDSSDLDIQYDPPHPEPHQDYKLRGHYGKTLHALAITTIATGSIAFVWLNGSMFTKKNVVVV